MVWEIVKDESFLRQPSIAATKKDKAVAEDLLDTLKAHAMDCIGLAANMIGERKNIIVVRTGNTCALMLNPEIVKHSEDQYETEEGCLSLAGTRPTLRYDWVEVAYQDRKLRLHTARFSGTQAQAVQHEIDHTKGILI